MLTEKSIAFIEQLRSYRRECREVRPYGTREILAGTECILHRPSEEKKGKSVFVFLHGGSWIGGDVVETDSLCKTITDLTGALSVNINYTKLDEKPFPNPVREILDVIGHIAAHSDEYGINPNAIVLSGCSAGGHLAAASAVKAVERGIKIARQILIYPFLDWTGMAFNPLVNDGIEAITYNEVIELFFAGASPAQAYLSPLAAEDDMLSGIAPADIIVCGPDSLKEHGILYYEKLNRAGIGATLKEYPTALHGFLETNRPDYRWKDENPSISPAQDADARDCERYIAEIVRSGR